ncbi:MAG: magnesium/cobalt transporter CorA [Acidobacteriota bacterium]|jgi:magnesium transporter|nr:magnesium/cobalt transporter CorA [Acidobacteriota bacterium]
MTRRSRRHPHAPSSHRRALPGSAPGTLIPDPEAARTRVRITAYDPERVLEKDINDIGEIRTVLEQWPVVWIQVTGLGDLPVVTQLGELFGLHRLALEDVINVHQRPKVEQYSDYCYIVVRAAHDRDGYGSDQISLFLGKGFVLSFQEREHDFFNPVLERIRGGKGRIRQAGPDHLAYALIDASIDCFFPVLERFGERVEPMEDAIIAHPRMEGLQRIHELRRGLITLRRTAWPLREAMMTLYREPNPWIRDEERIYLRDCYDHVIQIIDLLGNYRDLTSGLMEVYLSSTGNHTNEIMKVLTIISAVFIPMSLIAGIYGMNFPRQIPDLEWHGGFIFALGLMAAVAAGLLILFRLKGWLGGSSSDRS